MRNIIAIVLIVLGVVCIAGGIWGISLQIGSDVNPEVLSAAQFVLHNANEAVGKADDWLGGLTGGKVTFTGILNSMVGGDVDLTNDWSVSWFAFCHGVEILLGGIVGVETGLLLFKWGRR